MKNKFALILLISLLSIATDLLAGEIIVRGFYYGRNLYVRNPYLAETSQFCVKEVWVNGIKTQERIRATAFEINLDHLELNQRVVVRLIFQDGCLPEITNMHVIKDDSKFDIFNIQVDASTLNWATKSERNGSYFVLERKRFGDWVTIDTIRGKGSYELNQYSISLYQYAGDNEYKFHYFDDSSPDKIMTKDYHYFSEEDEIELYIEDEGNRVALSKVMDYEVKNRAGETVLKGEGVNIVLRNLPRGIYTIYVENTIHEIRKK